MYSVKINETSLKMKEFKGQRVVTFKDIDLCHQRAEGTAGRNFRKNKKHFIENEDYFVISPSKFQFDEIRRFGISSPKGGFLITETGYLMLVKSFTDDLAWSVQRELVKNYFRAKSEPQENQSYPSHQKFYKGVPVVLVKDVVNRTGLSRSTVRAALQKCILNKDYWLLKGVELAHFRQIYSEYNTAKHLFVIAESGVRKLAKLFNFALGSFGMVPVVSQPEKLHKINQNGEVFEIQNPLKVLTRLVTIAEEKEIDIKLKPFKGLYSALVDKNVGIKEDLPINQIIYEVAFELAHFILHKGKSVVGNTACNQKAHQIAVSFIKTLDVLSTH